MLDAVKENTGGWAQLKRQMCWNVLNVIWVAQCHGHVCFMSHLEGIGSCRSRIRFNDLDTQVAFLVARRITRTSGWGKFKVQELEANEASIVLSKAKKFTRFRTCPFAMLMMLILVFHICRLNRLNEHVGPPAFSHPSKQEMRFSSLKCTGFTRSSWRSSLHLQSSRPVSHMKG